MKKKGISCLILILILMSPSVKYAEEGMVIIDAEKSLDIVYEDAYAVRPEYFPKDVRPGIRLRESFKLQSKSKFGSMYSDIDYDDTNPETTSRKLKVGYRGNESDFIDEITIGDGILNLPGSKYLNYSQSASLEKGIMGFKAAFKKNKAKVTFIASQTKGLNKSKEFSGETQESVRSIADTAYTRWTFFQIAASATQLPLQAGQTKVYIDDLNGFNNNSQTRTFIPAGSTAPGEFDEVPQSEYTVDYAKGVLTFNNQVNQEYVIAATFVDAAGNAVGPLLIKNSDDSYSTEIKNRYLINGLEEVKKVEVYDLSQKLVPTPDYQIDASREQIVFISTQPFPDSVYKTPSIHVYDIYVTMRFKQTKTLQIGEGVLAGSEIVYRNGNKLKRDEDYTINNAMGIIELTESLGAGEGARVEYEQIVPGESKLLAGAAINYGKEDDPLQVGVSYLASWYPGIKEIPTLDNTPKKAGLIGSYMKYHVGGDDWKIQLDGEAALSNYNSNSFGAATLDNFEGSGLNYAVSFLEKEIMPASRPGSVTVTAIRNEKFAAVEQVYWNEINPKVPGDERVSVVSMSGTGAGWSGFMRGYPGAGIDIRSYKTFEVWVKSNGSGGTFNLDIGQISEDVNGNGVLDTEDKNHDGQLNTGEDKGILIDNSRYGSGDYLLTTEDMNGNNMFDTTNNYKTFSGTVDWTGWQKFVFTLPTDKPNRINYVRVWTQNTLDMKFADVRFSGTQYRDYDLSGGTLIVRNISNFQDTSYPDILNTDIYTRLYLQEKPKNVDDQAYQKKIKEEKALLMEYTLPQGKESSILREIKGSLADYKDLKVMIYNKQLQDAACFIRLGNGSDFYEFEIPLNTSVGTWQTYLLDKDKAKIVGSPSWERVTQLIIGVKNNGTGPAAGSFYINELFADDVIERQGIAADGKARFEYKELYVEVESEDIGSDFRSIEGEYRGAKSWGYKVGKMSKVMPINYMEKESNQSYLDESYRLDTQVAFNKHFDVGVIIKDWPKIIANLNESMLDRYTYQEKKTAKDIGAYYQAEEEEKGNGSPESYTVKGEVEADKIRGIEYRRMKTELSWVLKPSWELPKLFRLSPGYDVEYGVEVSSDVITREMYDLRLANEIQFTDWLKFAGNGGQKYFRDMSQKIGQNRYNIVEGELRTLGRYNLSAGSRHKKDITLQSDDTNLKKNLFRWEIDTSTGLPDIGTNEDAVWSRNEIFPFSKNSTVYSLGVGIDYSQKDTDKLDYRVLNKALEISWPAARLLWKSDKVNVSVGYEEIKNYETGARDKWTKRYPFRINYIKDQHTVNITAGRESSTTNLNSIQTEKSDKANLSIDISNTTESKDERFTPVWFLGKVFKSRTKTIKSISFSGDNSRCLTGATETADLNLRVQGNIEYFIIKNLAFRFGAGGRYYVDEISPVKNYWAYNISLGTKIIF